MRSAVGRRPATPDLPCASEVGAANDSASADVAGHGHRCRLGVDQRGYLRRLRFFASFARAALHASVTRRATSYEFHPSWVSIQPSGAEVAGIGRLPPQGIAEAVWGRATVAEGSAHARVELLPNPRHVRTLKTARKPVNPWAIAHCPGTFRDVSQPLRSVTGDRQRRGELPRQLDETPSKPPSLGRESFRPSRPIRERDPARDALGAHLTRTRHRAPGPPT